MPRSVGFLRGDHALNVMNSSSISRSRSLKISAKIGDVSEKPPSWPIQSVKHVSLELENAAV